MPLKFTQKKNLKYFEQFKKYFAREKTDKKLEKFLAMASTANVVLMRYSELEQGIEVFDAENRQIGTSKIAAKKVKKNWFCNLKRFPKLFQALKEMAITRAFLPAPILLIPPVVMSLLEK